MEFHVPQELSGKGTERPDPRTRRELTTVTNGEDTVRVAPLWVKIVLWVVAGGLMFTAAEYQTRTGPTYELRGEFTLGEVEHSYELIRSGNSYEDARVAIPNPGEGSVGALHL
jgi:hypothetical protein